MGVMETEVVMPRIKRRLHFKAVANQTLNKEILEIDESMQTTIMVVSGGYPEEIKKSK
jgi:phosphoribosylamine--glycine ligase